MSEHDVDHDFQISFEEFKSILDPHGYGNHEFCEQDCEVSEPEVEDVAPVADISKVHDGTVEDIDSKQI
jgi:hypothetical protein